MSWLWDRRSRRERHKDMQAEVPNTYFRSENREIVDRAVMSPEKMRGCPFLFDRVKKLAFQHALARGCMRARSYRARCRGRCRRARCDARQGDNHALAGAGSSIGGPGLKPLRRALSF